MATKDGRDAQQPYRVRAGGIWYWVDPTVPAADIEPGDTVIIYPVAGDASLAVLQGPFTSDVDVARPVGFSSVDGERFDVAPRDIAALHLAAIDEVQD
jgi:hypothetical protein